MLIPDGQTLPAAQVIQPKVEAEIALVLKRDITEPVLERRQLLSAIEAVVPAIEIVDSRIADWKITFADTVADNGSSSHFVLGDGRWPVDSIDLYACGMILEINGEVASLGAGAASLGHPLNAAAWLANTLLHQGESLRAGDIVLQGRRPGGANCSRRSRQSYHRRCRSLCFSVWWPEILGKGGVMQSVRAG